jgi:hypothetical protein
LTPARRAAAVRAFATERRYAAPTIERWLALPEADGGALLDLALELRLGEHQLRDLWEWAEEVAQRDASTLAGVLASPEIAAARRRPDGRNDRLRLVKSALRRLRYPQLCAAEERLAGLVRSLGLPPSVRVVMPDNLEGDALRVEIVAASAAGLRSAVARLAEATEAPQCDEIFTLLAESAEP